MNIDINPQTMVAILGLCAIAIVAELTIGAGAGTIVGAVVGGIAGWLSHKPPADPGTPA